jgi:hypothetical protein
MKVKIILILLTALAAFLASCSSSKKVTITTTRPAEITFPSSVQNLVIVDRTEYDESTLSVLEGIITGELPEEDEFGVQELIDGLFDQMKYSSRFNMTVAGERIKGNSLTNVLPEPLSWRRINALCKKYDADAVIAIELFDTDFVIADGVKKVKEKKKVNGKEREVEVNKYTAEGVADVTIGIRIYDPGSKSIVDQDVFNRSRSWNAEGRTIQDALNSLIAKNKATGYISRRIGQDYAYKIAPMPVRLTRSFETESDDTPELALGARLAEVGNWREAAEVWKSGISNAPMEDAGYLTYNIAVAYEILGDFDNALNWAEKSYVEYQNDDALRYVNILKNRMADEEQVRMQLNEP